MKEDNGSKTSWLEELSTDHSELVRRFESIAAGCDVDQLINCLALHIMFALGESDLAEKSGLGAGFRLELAAYYSRHQRGKSDEPPTVTQVGEAGEVLDQIATKYLLLTNKERVEEEDREYAELIRPLDIAIMEAKTVRSSAYPEQWESVLVGVFAPFGEWLTTEIGIEASRFCRVVWAMIRRAEHLVSAATEAAADIAESMRRGYVEAKKEYSEAQRKELALFQQFRTAEDASVYVFCKKAYEVAGKELAAGRADLDDYLDEPVSEAEWNAIIEMLALSNTRMAVAEDAVDLRQYPILMTDDSKLLPTDLGHTLEMFYLHLEALAEASSIGVAFTTHRGEWLEDQVVDCLARLFPKHALYRNLEYPDPTQGGKHKTELDVAVFLKPFLVLIECKSNRFHLPTRREDADKVKTSLQRIVNASYTQARRALRYIEENDVAVFNEKGTSRSLSLSSKDIQQTFLVSVSLQTLANLTSQLSRLKFFNLTEMDRFPLSVSLPVLELIAETAKLPAIFLHYLHRRQAIHSLGTEFQADELDIFGCYMQTRLQPHRLWDQGDKRPDYMTLSGYSDAFDRYMYGKRGDIPPTDLPKLEVGDRIVRLLQHLHDRRTPEGLSIAFALLDLSDGSVADLDSGLEQLPNHVADIGNANSFTAKSGDTVVSITAGNRCEPSALRDMMQMRAEVEKYRVRARRALAFGIEVKEGTPFEHAYYSEHAWQHDDEMDEIVRKHKKGRRTLQTQGRKVGPNELCPCGSGVKFKRCCMR